MKSFLASLTILLMCLVATAAQAGTAININGSTDAVAIMGYDPVDFFVQKKPIKGSPENVYEWAGAKWTFSTQENLQIFKADPERWAPQYGGHCSAGMAEGYISKKPTSGDFAVVGEKLYLFPVANNGGTMSLAWARQRKFNIIDGDKNWTKFKSNLENK